MKTWHEVKQSCTHYPGRNELPTLLEAMWDDIEPLDKPGALIEAWTMAEWPVRLVHWRDWQWMFDEVTGSYQEMYVKVDGEGEVTVEQISDLPSTYTIYRGCVRGMEQGMSWTTDRDVAMQFAKRFGNSFGKPLLVTMEVWRGWTYAKMDGNAGRKESEVILDMAIFETLEDGDFTIEEVVLENSNG